LNRNVNRFGINFMGCFGAFKALEVANAFAQMDPKNRVLVVCTELCSLHLQDDLSSDTILANSLFADGASAVIVGNARGVNNESPLYEIVKHSSFALDKSQNLMSWEASNRGYLMKLSGFVPLSLSRHIETFSNALIENCASIAECDWAIHPGGKAILQVIEKKLSLKKEQTVSSWETLADYGNMSSATILFVLENLLKKKSTNKTVVGLGFGPGLSVEGNVLRTMKS
jgi:predicted naringenin-chalcone synthase